MSETTFGRRRRMLRIVLSALFCGLLAWSFFATVQPRWWAILLLPCVWGRSSTMRGGR